MFAIGQLVKCIDGTWGAATGTEFQRAHCPNLPKVGTVYTVRSIEQLTAVHREGPAWFIRLREVVNPPISKSSEALFYARNFVPVYRSTVGVAALHEIRLNPHKRITYKSGDERRYDRKHRKTERAGP